MMEQKDKWLSLVTCLSAAFSTERLRDIKMRYNTNWSEAERTTMDMDMQRFAASNWFMAKFLYCSQKDYFDKMYSECQVPSERELFENMRKVIDKEMNEQLEAQILKEDDYADET